MCGGRGKRVGRKRIYPEKGNQLNNDSQTPVQRASFEPGTRCYGMARRTHRKDSPMAVLRRGLWGGGGGGGEMLSESE